MAFTMPLAASIVFVGKWPRLQAKGQGRVERGSFTLTLSQNRA